MEANLKGLRAILRKFDGFYTSSPIWSIARGGYDLYWEIYYYGIPIIQCVDNCIENGCLEPKIFKKAAKIIMQEYPWVKIEE